MTTFANLDKCPALIKTSQHDDGFVRYEVNYSYIDATAFLLYNGDRVYTILFDKGDDLIKLSFLDVLPSVWLDVNAEFTLEVQETRIIINEVY